MFYFRFPGLRGRARYAAIAALVLTAASACAPDVVDMNAPSPSSGGKSDGGSGPQGGPPPVYDAAPPPVFDAGAGSGQPVQDAECNLNGRWLVAQRELASAIGQDQAAHNWFYYEVSHEGADVLVTKGLHCGYEVIKVSALSAAVDSSGAWPSFLTHDSSAGRKGTYVKEGSNCHLKLDKEYTVRGATVSYYSNPSTTLPGKTEQANGSTPGWEDWDNDGNPGVSLKVSSTLASGVLYTAQRDWTQYDGTTPLSATKFQVSITYDGEQIALRRSSGSPQAIESTSSPSSDTTQHYAWIHKLDDGQATGSDDAICAAVRQLKDTLVPEAAK